MGIRQAIQQARLYGILDLGYVAWEQALPMAQLMLEGGVQVLQLRGKGCSVALLQSLGKAVVPLCRDHGVPFIINDYPDLVGVTGADGVHLGQDDLSVAGARALLGPGAVIGKSTHSLAQVRAAREEAPDYIGFGPLFSTATKPDYVPIGLEDIAEAHQLISCPIFCIGGIKLENLPNILAAGAQRVVVVSGILQAPDVKAYCDELRNTLRTPRQVAD